MFGGEDDVAFVFAVFIVHHDDGPAGRHGRHGVLNGVQPVALHPAAVGAVLLALIGVSLRTEDKSRSVYFARTSTSRLTRPPTGLAPRPVSSSVVGISPTSNHGSGFGGCADGGNGQGYTVDGDRSFLGDVPGKVGGHGEP